MAEAMGGIGGCEPGRPHAANHDTRRAETFEQTSAGRPPVGEPAECFGHSGDVSSECRYLDEVEVIVADFVIFALDICEVKQYSSFRGSLRVINWGQGGTS